MFRIFFFSSFIIFFYCSTDLFAELFKCISPDGSEYYSNRVCPPDAEKEVVIKSSGKKSAIHTETKNYKDPLEPFEENNGSGKVELQLITQKYKTTKSEVEFLNTGVKFLHQYYAQVFDFDDDITIRMRIIGDYNDYKRYLSKVTKYGGYAGFYSSKIGEGVINGSRKKSGVLSTTLHESSHAILDEKVPSLPIWVNEGLAEYFERMVPNGNKMVIRQQNSRHIQLLRWIATGELLTMKEYLKLNNYSWRSKSIENDQITRTMAWSIVHFLMSSEKGQKSLVKILQAFANFDSRDPVKIFNKSYQGGIRRLENEWLKYIQSPPTIHTYEIY